jgi:DNA polymerase III subunit epsilon
MHELIEGADYLVAHNAPFDRTVLYACCRAAKTGIHEHEFVCTVQVARNTWNIRPTTLNNVCDFCGIELNHHEALSDARAAANIMIARHGATKNPK